MKSTDIAAPARALKSAAKTRAGRRQRLVASFAPWLVVAVTVPAGPANAACLQSGSIVTCSGTTNTSFGTGAENNLAITVQPNASIVVGNAQKAIHVGNGNTAINNGAIVVGNSAVGMQGFDNNHFTNTGTMTVGAGSVAMFSSGSNNAFFNSGTMNSTALGAVGIDVLGTGNTITNSGTITLTGSGSYGIASSGTGHTILNSGFITVGSGASGTNGAGVSLMSGSNFTNTGIVTAAGDNGIGVDVGNNNTLTNGGTIQATGATGIGIGFSGITNTIVNDGIVRGGQNGYSLFSFGTTGTAITNNGTLDGQIAVGGNGNSLINSGLIAITDPATALMTSNLAFAGSFSQTAQGTLALRVDNGGNHDGLSVEQASLNGTLRAVLRPGLYGTTTSYTNVVASAAPLNGQFAGVTSSSAFFSAVATYNSNTVDLTLTRHGFGNVAGETANQRSIGNALETGYSPALTGATATFYAQLLQAGSLRVLDHLSGEGTSGTQNTAFGAGSLFGQTMEGQMSAWRAGNRDGGAGGIALGYAAEPAHGPASAFAAVKAPAMVQPLWNVWAAGFGAGQSLAGNAITGSASLNNRAAGGSMGVDYLADPDLLVGIAAGGSSSTFAVDERATSGRLEGGHVGGYAMRRFGASYLSAQIAYSHFNNTTTRTITGVGPLESATGTFASDQLGGRLEVGRSFEFGHVSATPFAAIQAARLWQAAYSESSTAGAGAGVLGLSYAAQTVTSLPAFVGVKFDGRASLENGMLWTPFVHAAWVHEFEPSRTITVSMNTVPIPAFAIAGASAASDAARVDLGSRLALDRRWELSARVTGEFSNLGQTYSGMGAVRASW